MIRKILLASTVVAAMGTFSVPAQAQLYVGIAPPAARVEVVPAPRTGYTWAPGYWDWRADRYAWVSGHWEADRPGYAYVAPTWVERNGRWYMEHNGWARREARREAREDRREQRRDEREERREMREDARR
jgi:hypothetical protein